MNFPKSMTRNAFRFRAAALAGCLAACSSSPGTNPPIPARLGMAVEPAFSALSGVAFAPQPTVQVLDGDAAPIAARGILVTVTLASGGGTIAGTLGVRTDDAGRAAFTDLVLAGPLGPRTLRFSAPGLSAALSRQIDVAAGPASIALINAGNSQTTAAGTAVPVAPSVRVTDGSDNPVVGVRVTFTVTGGGGTVTGAQPLTNVQGIATIGQWILGTSIGQNSLSATIDGITTSLTFQATGTVGGAAQLALVEGDGQSAGIGTAVPTSPAVRITDAFGNVVPGLSVTFAVGSGGGALTGGTPISDGNGVARVGSWRLGFVPGVNTLTASRDGIPSITFTATSVDFSVANITAGVTHACAVGADQLTRCWGDNSTSQLGNGSLQPDSVPVAVSAGSVFASVVAAENHSCALATDGLAWCWGDNTNGELGDGTTQASALPVPVVGGMVFTQLSASGTHTCGLDAAGAAWCWGNGANGRLGDGLLLSRVAPTSVAGGHVFTQISAGTAHTCGRRNDGVVLCWGSNANGRLGDGSITQRVVPTQVSSPALFTSVSAGGAFTCGIDTHAAALCWGANASGQIGDGTNSQRNIPTAVVGGQTFTNLTTGTAHACGVTSLFAAYCWGENASGRLGDGTGVDRNAPAAVIGGLSYSAISAGDQHTCARSTSGSAICWGSNVFGQLGDGTLAGKATPVGVKRP